MKITALAKPACLALLLSLGGCFGGEDAEDNPVGPRGPGPGPGSIAGRVSPGLYAGDYSQFATAQILGGPLESEFLVGADGSYRFFWFIGNTPVADVRGDWSQRDSSLYFDGVAEAFLDPDDMFFYPPAPGESDTNAVRDITDTSFTRKEWTPFRQKPLWITYRKIAPENRLADGSFSVTKEIFDTIGKYRNDIRLDGAEFSEEYVETFSGDTAYAYLAGGGWSQIGSALVIDPYASRLFDTASHAYPAEWDTLPGYVVQRIRDVSDTAFQMWIPGYGTWEAYRRE